MTLTRTTFLRLALAAGTGVLGTMGGPAAAWASEPIRPIVIWARAQAANPQAYQAAELIKQTWEKLGLQVEVRGVPRPQQSDIVWYNRDKWDTTMWQMVGRPERSDPDEFVYNLFLSSTAEKGYNFVGYINPKYDEVANLQRRTTDRTRRQQYVKQAQEIIAQDQPYLFLVYPTKVFAFDKNVFKEGTEVDQPGLGIKNIWTFLQIEPKGAQKDLILNSSDELNAINPFYISGATDSWITELIWDRLMRIGPDGLPQPWAAESVRWTSDTAVEVVLREGMKWHDGQPVTLDDVIFSFTAPAEGLKVPMYKPFVTNIASIEKVGERGLRFTLKTPDAAFETASLAKLNIAPRHIWAPLLANLKEGENAEAVLEEKRIGSGPFRFARWVSQQEVVLEANRDHWAVPKIDRWILRIVPNVEATLGMLRKGEVNFLSDYTGDPEILQDIARQDGDLALRDAVDIGFQYLAFNNRRAPFDDPAFRRALSFAVDRKLIAAAAFNGYGIPANSHVSPALPFWYDKTTEQIPVGLEVARKLLADAGYRVVGGRLHYPEGKTEKYGPQ